MGRYSPFYPGEKVVVNPTAVHTPVSVGLSADRVYTVKRVESAPLIEGCWRVWVNGVEDSFSVGWFIDDPASHVCAFSQTMDGTCFECGKKCTG